MPELKGLLRRQERILVRRRPVHDRDGHVQQTKVYRQLSAVMVDVVQHVRPQRLELGPTQNLLALKYQPPVCLSRIVGQLAERFLGAADAILELAADLAGTGGRSSRPGRGELAL